MPTKTKKELLQVDIEAKLSGEFNPRLIAFDNRVALFGNTKAGKTYATASLLKAHEETFTGGQVYCGSSAAFTTWTPMLNGDPFIDEGFKEERIVRLLYSNRKYAIEATKKRLKFQKMEKEKLKIKRKQKEDKYLKETAQESKRKKWGKEKLTQRWASKMAKLDKWYAGKCITIALQADALEAALRAEHAFFLVIDDHGSNKEVMQSITMETIGTKGRHFISYTVGIFQDPRHVPVGLIGGFDFILAKWESSEKRLKRLHLALGQGTWKEFQACIKYAYDKDPKFGGWLVMDVRNDKWYWWVAPYIDISEPIFDPNSPFMKASAAKSSDVNTANKTKQELIELLARIERKKKKGKGKNSKSESTEESYADLLEDFDFKTEEEIEEENEAKKKKKKPKPVKPKDKGEEMTVDERMAFLQKIRIEEPAVQAKAPFPEYWFKQKANVAKKMLAGEGKKAKAKKQQYAEEREDPVLHAAVAAAANAAN